MKILLTGASSYLGARLYFDLRSKYKVVGSYRENKIFNEFIHLEITDKKEIERVFNKIKPDIIIHAAAAEAKWCEAHSEEAIRINQESTKDIVTAADKIGAKIIYISSIAAKNPFSVYSRTKKKSEKYIKMAKNGWVIIRPCHVLGISPNTINDRAFNRLLNNLDGKTEAVYDISWKAHQTYIGHISEVIEKIIDRKIVGEIITVGTREKKTRYDTAWDILTPFGIQITPVDKKDKTPVISDSLDKLKGLGLPEYSYDEIIAKMIMEIKQREDYKL